MVAKNFPTSPTVGTQYENWVWNGSQWDFAQTLPGGLPAGSIIQWSGATAPVNWLLCDGTAVSRTTYASLFSVVGTTYGTGDGSTTFNLPDLRGRVPVGKNGGTFGTLGASGGAESVTLTANQSGLRDHTHVLPASVGAALNSNDVAMRASGTPDTNFRTGLAKSASSAYGSADIAKDALEAHTNLQPYLVTNYIIKATAAVTPGESELAPRVGALELADATTNKSGLVPVVPSSVTVASGTATVSSSGLITISGASSISINNSLLSTKDYFITFTGLIASGAGDFAYRWRSGTTDISTLYYGINLSGVYTGTSSVYGAMNGGALGYLGPAGNALTNVRMDASPRVSSSNVMNRSYSAWHGYYINGGYNTNGLSSAPNGITIYTTASTISGTIQVYAYN